MLNSTFSSLALLVALTACNGNIREPDDPPEEAPYDIRAAILRGDHKRVRELLSDDATLANTKDKHGYTPLHWATRKGHAGIVKLLLDHDADIEARGHWDDPPIFYAVGHPEALKVLLNAGADPDIRISMKGTPPGEGLLHRAASHGQVESAKLLLAAGLDVDLLTGNWRTPLYLAVISGQVEMVKYLLKNKADPNGLAETGEWTPMAVAARIMPARGDERSDEDVRLKAIIEVLRSAGARFDIFGAIALGDRKEVNALITKDRSVVDSRTPSGYPALHEAVALGHRDIVALLLARGGDANILNHDKNRGGGYNLLHAAAFWDRPEIAKLLIDHKADVNAKGPNGLTPLHRAALRGTLEVARILVTAGADINAKDDDERTPLSMAGERGKGKATADFLRKNGGKR